MSLSDTTRRYIMIGQVLFVIVGIFTALMLGKKQDEAFQMDNAIYNQAVQTFQQGNFVETIEITNGFKNNQISSEDVNYLIGLSAMNIGEINKGLKHMQRALEINPHNVEDSMFMLQLAEVFVGAEMKVEAEIVLEKCSSLPIPESYPEYKERIVQLQIQLATQS